jgi:O-antigen ligase
VKHLLERFGGFLPAALALALPIVFIPTASDSYILPRASIVIAGACLGVGIALLLPGGPSLGALRWPLLAAAAAAVLAFITSVSWPLSLAGSYTRYESLPMRLSYLGLLASSVWLIRTPRQGDWMVAGFVLGTSIACFKAWLQWILHAPFRPDGDLGNANLLAALAVMAVPLAIDRARRGRYFAAAWAAAVVVMVIGLLVTTSRSGGLGVIAGCLALLAFAVPRRFGLAVSGAAAALVGIVLAVMLASPLRILNNDPPELRLHLWGDGLRMVAARPLTGWGEDATGLSFGRFLSQDYASLVTFDRIHSGPLDVAATQGVLGLAALGWVLFVVFRAVWRGRSEPHVAGLSAALVGFSVWVVFNFDWAPATGAFWLLAGALWSAASPSPRSGEQSEGAGSASVTGSARRAGVRNPVLVAWQPALAVMLAMAAIEFAVFPVLADVWYLKGRADLSVKVDPLQAQYHWALGSIDELRRAAALGETEPGFYVTLGDRELQLGNRARARSAYKRALEIDPYYTPAAQRLAALSG